MRFYEEEERIRQKGEIFIPLLAGIGLAISLRSAGAVTAAIVQTYHLAGDFRDKLDQVLASTTDSLESLKRQMNSLAGVVLKNRRTLDLITAEHRGTSLILGEECWFYVNESNVETNIKTKKNKKKKQNSVKTWLLSRFQPTGQLSPFISPCFLAVTLIIPYAMFYSDVCSSLPYTISLTTDYHCY